MIRTILKNRNKLLTKYRKKFWKDNFNFFEKNIEDLFKKIKPNKKYKLFFVTSCLITGNKFPYEKDTWSSTNIISASKKQGFEIMVFMNSDRSGFLSKPALLPIVVHESQHIRQIEKHPKKYLLSMFDDKLSFFLEAEAEKEIMKINDEFRKEMMLESIVYCFDIGGWNRAQKMADYLYKDIINQYGGGYKQMMNDTEYKIFKEAKIKKDIKYFIKSFL